MSQLREFVVRLSHGQDRTTVHPLAYDVDQAELLARLITGAWGQDALVEVLGVRPSCDYCDGVATRVERGSLYPLCERHAREQNGSCWRTETRHLGDKHLLSLAEVGLAGTDH
ncbi:hypothetical protein JNUCC0626_40280 [Lentzea sp. JNUCC 0626]|uniref:hypothetical protein n=1 Tax=Lentzea sp. JNUCC 0626 TaxID=3367513 RepID=UPI0037484901